MQTVFNSVWLINNVFLRVIWSVADPGSGSDFFHPGSRIDKIPEPGSASKNLSISNLKSWYWIPKNVHSGSRIMALNFFSVPYSWVKKAPDPGSGSATLVTCGTHDMQLFCAVPLRLYIINPLVPRNLSSQYFAEIFIRGVFWAH